MNNITTRPKPKSSANFDEDICALLIHHRLVDKKALIQNVKIFLGVDKIPFVEITQLALIKKNDAIVSKKEDGETKI